MRWFIENLGHSVVIAQFDLNEIRLVDYTPLYDCRQLTLLILFFSRFHDH